LRLITVFLPEPYIQKLDKLVLNKYYPNRAEAIRIAVRDLIYEHEEFKKNEKNI